MFKESDLFNTEKEPDKLSQIKKERVAFHENRESNSLPENNLPMELKDELIRKREIFKKDYNIDDQETLDKLTKFLSKELPERCMDNRFNIPDKEYLRMEIVDQMDRIIAEKEVEQFDRFIILNMDVNGLKAVNDIAGHEKGDLYLERIANVLTKGEVVTDLRNRGVDVFISSTGGDEFTIIINGINGEDNLSGEELVSSIQEEISSINCDDLIDFSDEKIIEKLGDLGDDIPEYFSFTASISGGSCNLKKSWNESKFSEKKEYLSKLKEIMGGLLRESDERSFQDKRLFKEALKLGSKEERFLSKVLKRNSETMVMEEDIESLLADIENLKKENKELKRKLKYEE